MELGEKLKTARLEAGLSQRQLCGDTITRNMLSQIENGSARPSMATLKALCSRLGKPVSYFVEGEPSENLALLHRASRAAPREALQILKDYLSPDPVLDGWYHYLSDKSRLTLARQALSENRVPYAAGLLQEVTADCRELTLLKYAANMAPAGELLQGLPDNTEEMRLRGMAAYEQGEYEKCLCCLTLSDTRDADWYLLRGDALIALERHEEAIAALQALPETKAVCARLELCYKKLSNYQKAYEYACKQR